MKHELKSKYSDYLRMFALVCAAAVLQGCGEEDAYSKVKEACSYIPEYIEVTLRPACKAALESVIPYDNESFANAPEGLKDKVTEAFFALVAYPLKAPPANAILGVTPQHSGAISDGNWSIFERYSNPNQAAFNFAINNVDVISYTSDSQNSSWYLMRLVTQPIPPFRNLIVSAAYANEYRTYRSFHQPFIRAAILLHEARHGDSILHTTCLPTNPAHAGEDYCDPGMDGAFGFEFLYYEYLIHGSTVIDPRKARAPLEPTDLSLVATDLCVRVHTGINVVYPELKELFSQLKCNQITPEWVAEQEGIELPPFWF